MIPCVKRDSDVVENRLGRYELGRVVRAVVRVAKLITTLAALALNGSLFVLSLVAICAGATPIGPLGCLAAVTLASFFCAAYILFMIIKDPEWLSSIRLDFSKAKTFLITKSDIE
ncbi:inclusion membrane protein IncF [Chlamydia sp.]|uniref:inclusion membrane protein IncF n=1 Tax=Chlamydia sp. TaxID=35827 RepID=UPI0025BA265A|nr:inclusion membrane protein IncF [Chlamydia sp.]MBQ8498741.1 inclusion membrane protein IncF [Chlamydia sp.]